jgi:hypothetical protein
MNSHRPNGPADWAESERLLDAARAGRPPVPGADPLAHLLAAAAAPAESGELAGEEQALTAFRAARVNPAPAPAPAPRRFRLRVGVAAWTAGLAATATAGVAFAAVSLERPEQPAPPPAPTTAGSTGADGTGSPSRSEPGSPTAGKSSSVPFTAPAPTWSGGPGKPASDGKLAGLCRAYFSKSATQQARALQTPAFADLIAAAGGPDQVEGYCIVLVPKKSPAASAEASASPVETGAPSGKPKENTDG